MSKKKYFKSKIAYIFDHKIDFKNSWFMLIIAQKYTTLAEQNF